EDAVDYVRGGPYLQIAVAGHSHHAPGADRDAAVRRVRGHADTERADTVGGEHRRVVDRAAVERRPLTRSRLEGPVGPGGGPGRVGRDRAEVVEGPGRQPADVRAR